MTRHTKKPITVEAVQWTGTKKSWDEIHSLGNIEWLPGEIGSYTFYIKTLEGDHLVRKGDYVIKGVQGEFYPCKPDIFEQTYEKVKGEKDSNRPSSDELQLAAILLNRLEPLAPHHCGFIRGR